MALVKVLILSLKFQRPFFEISMITWKMKPDGKNAMVEHTTQTSGTCYSQSIVAKADHYYTIQGSRKVF